MPQGRIDRGIDLHPVEYGDLIVLQHRETADGVFRLMLELAHEKGTAFVLVSHDEQLAARCGRVQRLVRGMLEAAIAS